MDLTKEQAAELSKRYSDAQKRLGDTLPTDQQQQIRWEYYAELRKAGTAIETMSEPAALDSANLTSLETEANGKI